VLAGWLAAISSFGAALSSSHEFCRSIARAAISFGVALCLHYCALGQSEAGFFPLATRKKSAAACAKDFNVFGKKPPKSPYFEENKQLTSP
jgi:hypothetical protein